VPSRVLREGILSSDRVDQLSEMAELFYRRLQSVVDDYGRYAAHPTQLRTNCYPARIDRYTDAQVFGWRLECQRAGLLTVYRVGKIDYLELADFRQQAKSKSKFPGPSDGLIQVPETPATTPVHDPCTDGERPVHDPFTFFGVEGGVEGEGGVAVAGAREAGDDDPEAGDSKPANWAVWATWWRSVRGIEVNPSSIHDRKRFIPLAERWAAAGVTTRQMRAAIGRAEAEASEPIAYLPAYVDRVLASMQRPPDPRDAERADFLHSFTGGLMGAAPTDERTIDVEPQRHARLADPRS